MKDRRSLFKWMAASALAGACPPALAQAAASSAVGSAAGADAGAAAGTAAPTGRLLFGIPPGAAGTTLAQSVLAQLARQGSLSFRLEHLLGRDGRRAAETTKAARPDGQTLLHTQSAQIEVFPAVFRELGYGPGVDLIPLAALAEYSFMLLAGPRVPASVKTLDEYLLWVKSNPSSRQVGVVLRGSQGWLLTQRLARERDAPLQLVSYAGGTGIIDDLLTGGLAAGIVVTGNAVAARRDGRLRAIAVSSPQRWPDMADTPTFEEQGLKDAAMAGWYGWFGPAGMPEDLIERIHNQVNEALGSAAVKATLHQLAMPVAGWSRPQIQAHIVRETSYYAELIRQSGLDKI